MDLFDIAAKITLDSSGYEKGLEDADSKGSSFASKLKSGLGTAAKVGGAAIAAIGTGAVALGKSFISGAKETAEYGDQIDKMSQKLGLSKEAYQEWDYVLGQSGADINSISTGLKTLTNKLDDAKNGGADAQAMFAALGLSLEDLQSMSREDVFANVIAGFQGMEDSTERAALANDLFGKSGQELTPLFNTTIEETNGLRQAAHDLGFVMSDEAVSAAADFNDALDTLQRTIGGLKKKFMSDYLPAFTSVMDGLAKIFAGDSKGGVGKIKKGVSDIINTLSEKIPEFLDIGFQIVDGLVTAINDNLPMVIQKGADLLLNGIIPGILEQLPSLVETAFSIIAQLVSSIGEALPELIPAAVSIIIQIVESLLDNIDLLIDAAISLIMGLAEGILNAIPILLEKAPEIVIKLVSAIIRNAPKLLEAAVQLIGKLGEGIASLWNTVMNWGKDLVDKIWEGIQSLWSKVTTWGRDIIDKVWDGLKGAITDAVQWGKDLITNFWNGIKSKLDWLWDGVKSVAQGVADFLGFSEPKKGPLSKFHTFAPDMMDLFMKGIDDNRDKLNATIADAFNFGNIVVDNPPAMQGYSGSNGIDGSERPIILVLDTGEVVGATVGKMDEALGNENVLKLRWAGVNA